jgi:hypothetical protein
VTVESIKCQECGSGEVTEFKHGSYVCGHCETIFKWTNPGTGFVGCEVDGCGITPIGRCSTCGRAYCGTHQARDERTKYVDWCGACQVDDARQMAAATGEAEERARELLATIADPVERMVATLRTLYIAPSDRWQLVHRGPGLRPRESYSARLASAVCPEALNGCWSAHEISRWFLARVAARGLAPDSSAEWRTYPRRFGKSRDYRLAPSEPAWRFLYGSTCLRQGRDQGAPCDALIFRDGRIDLGPDEQASGGIVRSGNRYNFNGGALIRMGAVLGIPCTGQGR